VSARRHPWWLPLAALAGALALRLLAATWRYQRVPAPDYERALLAGEKFVYVFWHSGMLPLAMDRGGEGIAVLVSQHHDGELIARLLGRLGYVTARGSSTRGGDTGVRELLAWAERGRALAVTPDGPRGPAEVAKEGAAWLASRTGLRVVAIGIGVGGAWRLKSWDRFRVPRPFARVALIYGAPLVLAPEDRGNRERLESAIREAAVAARTLVGEAA
jgi:hypothetical protein